MRFSSKRHDKRSLSIAVLAAYNEEKHIAPIIQRTKKYVNKVIVVDDGSRDNTAAVAKKSGATVIRLARNQGVGAATAIGIRHALALRADAIIVLDADGQHNPDYIPEFLAALKNADYAYGRRNLSKYPLNRKIGNFALSFLANLFCPTGIRDTECGFRAFTGNAARKFKLSGKRYEREMDFVWNVWKNRLRIAEVLIEVPVFYPKHAIARGFRNFLWLVKKRLFG